MEEVFTHETVNRIMIGLGGQGCRIVGLVANYLDTHGGIPSNEGFIFIDSNDADLAGICRNIVTKNAVIHKKSLPMPAQNIFTASNPWFPVKFISLVGGIGAGQRRVFGKALYNIHRDGIEAIITKTANDLKARTNEDGFVIILVGSLGGGTGSSILTNLSIDIRNWIKKDFKDPIILGFGILPSMDEEKITIGNAMATLKELHFILSQKDRKDKYSNPFKIFVLIGRKVAGAKDDDALREIAVRFFVDLGFVPGKKKTEDKWFDLNDLMSAVAPLTGSFSTIGYHLVEFPANKILLLFEADKKITELNGKLVNLQADINSFTDNITDMEVKVEGVSKNIAQLEESVREIEINKQWFSRKKVITEIRGKLEMSKNEYDTRVHDINALSIQLKELGTKESNLDTELKTHKAYREKIHQQILTPSSSINMHQITLTDNEINGFRGREIELDVTKGEAASTFRRIMDKLGKFEEYDLHVHKPFVELRIATSPLLNYRHTMNMESMDQNVVKILAERDFIKVDGDRGGIIDEDTKIGYIAAILSSNKDNIDEQKMGKEYAENILRGAIAKHAQIFPLNVPLDRFNVNIYTLMIGLHPWAPAPGYPSRLGDLDKMQEIYKSSKEDELFLNHSFFMGDFQAFNNLTGASFTWGDGKASVSSVIQFWKNYELVDVGAKWSRVPITIAEILRTVEELDNRLSMIKPKLELLEAPTQFTPDGISNLRPKIQNVCNDLNQLDKSLNGDLMKFVKKKDHIHEINQQLGSEDVIDEDKSNNIRNFLETTSGRIKIVSDKINKMGTLIGNDIPQRFNKIDVFIKEITIDNQTPQVENQMIEIGRNIEDIRPKIPDIGKNIHKIGVPLDDIRISIGMLTEKLTKMGK